MKEKSNYHEASYGKKSLLTVALVFLAVCLAALAGGIALLVLGCKSDPVGQIVWKVIVGAVLILAGLGGSGFAFYMLFVGMAMINNKNGSVKDGNRAIGTANTTLCPKCGREVGENASFCNNCGEKLAETKQCECGALNNADAQYCSACGKKL